MLRLNSVRFKISFLYIAVLGLILVIYSAFLYLSLHYTLYDELDNELSTKATEIAGIISSYLDAIGYDRDTFSFVVKRAVCFEGEHPEQHKILNLEELWLKKVDKLDLKEDYINILDYKGNSIVRSNNLREGPPLLSLKITPLEDTVFKDIKFEKRNLRVISLPFSYNAGGRYTIQVATSLKPVIHLLQVRLMHIIVSIPVILVISSLFSRLFTRKILAPVLDVTKAASNITHEDLSARVRAEHADEEMKYLVNAFNEMISRLDESFRYIAEFSSHVAHELKTPLAIIKGESEVALRKERSVQEYKDLIKINLDEVDRMLRIINDLLLLTRVDYKPEVFKFERLDLVEFLEEIYEQVKVLASRKNISVAISVPEGQRHIKGDRLHLRRLFFNLLDNAIKFTPEKGQIGVSLEFKDKKAAVSISDTGIGIPEGDIPKIFNRFYRVEGSREQNIMHGVGLGLSISQSIAKIHQGDIKVDSELNKGTTFIVSLPLL